MHLLELRPDTLEAAVALDAPLFLPFGTVEWHSDHLPLGLDTLVAEAVCRQWAGAAGVVAPAISWGIGGVPFPGTVRFDPDTLEALYRGLFAQCAHLGFRRLCAVPGHYGLEQLLALKRAALWHQRQGGGAALVCPVYELSSDLGYDGADHAGLIETSLMLWARADLVDRERLERPEPLDGVIGRDPRTASAEQGERLVQAAGERVWARLERLAASARERSAYLDALGVQVQVLELLARARSHLPRARVPPLSSPRYLQALQHLAAGEDIQAKATLNEVWSDLLDKLKGEL
ncbi:MAG: creatininase family protein [Ramlibacter sp.]|nr:creatininase family protein [Cryobacterium sp.]